MRSLEIPSAVFLIFSLLTIPTYAEDCKRAIELYNKGILLSEDSAQKELYFKRLFLYVHQTLRFYPVYNNLADLYERRGNYSRALVHYRKAIEIKSDLATSYFSVGDIFLMLEDYYSAYIMYTKGLKYQEDDEKTLVNIKRAKEGFREKMVSYFDFNSAEIADHYLYRLQLIGKSAQKDQLKRRKIAIEGYTDNSGPKDYNQYLSLKRAKRVKQHILNSKLWGRSPRFFPTQTRKGEL